MNIIKLQNDLKNVSDQALINYVRNPNGEVPSYLALSEIQRRNEMRNDYVKNNPSKTTVAQDLEQTAHPMGLAMLTKTPMRGHSHEHMAAPEEQGVASLPTGEMFNEQNYATGGIVAFDDGGYVAPTDYDPMEAYRRTRELGQANVLARSFGKPVQTVQAAGIQTPYDAALEYYRNMRKQVSPLVPAFGELSSGIGALENRRQSWLAGSMDPYSRTSPIGSQPNLEGLQEPVPTAKEQAAKDIAAKVGEVKQEEAKTPAVNPYGTDAYSLKPLSVQEAMEQTKEAQKLAGVDPEFYKKQAADLLKQREELTGEKTDARDMALVKAGLEIMGGTSQYAMTNIGKGAAAGVEQYGKDIKDIKAEDRLLKAADMKLAEAQNAQQRGDAAGAIKAVEERQKLLAELQHYKMVTNATIQAANIGAASRTGSSRLPGLFAALNKTMDPAEKAQIQNEIDRIVAGESDGASVSKTAIPADIKSILSKYGKAASK